MYFNISSHRPKRSGKGHEAIKCYSFATVGPLKTKLTRSVTVLLCSCLETQKFETGSFPQTVNFFFFKSKALVLSVYINLLTVCPLASCFLCLWVSELSYIKILPYLSGLSRGSNSMLSVKLQNKCSSMGIFYTNQAIAASVPHFLSAYFLVSACHWLCLMKFNCCFSRSIAVGKSLQIPHVFSINK